MLKIYFINVVDYPILNIGLAYVISAVKKAGYKTGVIDLAFHPKDYIEYVIKVIKRENPDIIGFSTITVNFKKSLFIAEKIKEAFPKILMIWGGSYPTVIPEETINYSVVDAICIGEGEETLPEYLDRLNEGLAPRVKGIWYKHNGQIIENELRPFIDDLDSVPFPDWNCWDVEKYFKGYKLSINNSLYVLASRGCPYDCYYCANHTISSTIPGKYYRTRSAENVIEEIKRNYADYASVGLREIAFADETFGLNLKQFDRFLKLYRKENLDKKLKWGCQTRADVITAGWVKKAKESGCILIETAVETGNEKLRFQLYNKSITNDQLIKTSMILKDQNIFRIFYIMTGAPGETKRDILDSFDFTARLEPSLITVSIVVPLPKTNLEKLCREKDFLNFQFTKSGLPRIETPQLSLGQFNMVMWVLMFKMVIRYIKTGMSYLGFIRFFPEIIRYILNINSCRPIGFNNPLIQVHMFMETIAKPYLRRNNRI